MKPASNVLRSAGREHAPLPGAALRPAAVPRVCEKMSRFLKNRIIAYGGIGLKIRMPWFNKTTIAQATLVIALAGVLLLSAFALHLMFSGGHGHAGTAEAEMTGRIYVKNEHAAEVSWTLEDETLVTIINLNEGVAWLLMPEKHRIWRSSPPEDPSILESDEYEESQPRCGDGARLRV